jgi:hypothetical protein
MKFHIKKSAGFTAIEALMDWVVPIVGGCLTLVLLRYCGFRSGWWICLALPGALLFQWAFLFALMGLDRLLKRKQGRGRK